MTDYEVILEKIADKEILNFVRAMRNELCLSCGEYRHWGDACQSCRFGASHVRE